MDFLDDLLSVSGGSASTASVQCLSVPPPQASPGPLSEFAFRRSLGPLAPLRLGVRSLKRPRPIEGAGVALSARPPLFKKFGPFSTPAASGGSGVAFSLHSGGDGASAAPAAGTAPAAAQRGGASLAPSAEEGALRKQLRRASSLSHASGASPTPTAGAFSKEVGEPLPRPAAAASEPGPPAPAPAPAPMPLQMASEPPPAPALLLAPLPARAPAAAPFPTPAPAPEPAPAPSAPPAAPPMPPAAPLWARARDCAAGARYWHCAATGETTHELPAGATTECGWAHDEARGLWVHAAAGISCRVAPPPRKLKAQLKAIAAAAVAAAKAAAETQAEAQAAAAAAAQAEVAAAAAVAQAGKVSVAAETAASMNRKMQRRMRALSKRQELAPAEADELQALLARAAAVAGAGESREKKL